MSLPDIDREVKGQYELVIQAKDMVGQLGGLVGTTTVNVTLSDVNDNPPHFTQSENLPPEDSFPITAQTQMFLFLIAAINSPPLSSQSFFHSILKLVNK